MPAALPIALALTLSLLCGLSPASAALDPATAAMAGRYAEAAHACMQRSVTMGVRAGRRTRPALLENTTARCGGDWLAFLVAHGETMKQAQGELVAMADRAIDDALKAPRP